MGRAVFPRMIDMAKTRRMQCCHRAALVANVFIILAALDGGRLCNGNMYAMNGLARLEYTTCQDRSIAVLGKMACE